MIRRLLLVPLLLGAVRAEEWQVEGLPVPVEVSLPDNHDPAIKWPTVFFYHGTNGRPSTHLIREHAGTRDWIVVGMTYRFAGAFTYTPENLEKELVILRRTRDGMAAKYGVDPKRLYVSGFSQGGWMSGLLFQAERSLAGAVILGAGHLQDVTPKRGPYPPGTPVFLGVGRLDGNYPFALKARLFYGKLGAAVTMETWPDLKHEYPKLGSPALKEWFLLRNGGQVDGDAVESELRGLAKLTPLKQWQALLELRERPFYNVAGTLWKEVVARKISELEQDPEVGRESRIFKKHRQLLADEVNAVTLPDLVKVNNAYVQLAQQAGSSPQVEQVVVDAQRVAALLQTNKARNPQPEAPKPIAPVLPKQDRGFPRNPLVR